MTLVETGTRALIGAVFGPTDEGETAYALRLLHLLRPDMLVLWDKGFDANGFLAQVTATGAKVLGRLRSNRRAPVLARLDDGSYLSMIGTVNVRIFDAEITVTCSDGTVFTGSYRLVTTLTDARRHSARALINHYHERWEHESTYFALRHTILAGRNLRSGDRVGLEQEMWALLTLYQALRATGPTHRPRTRPRTAAFAHGLPRRPLHRPSSADDTGFSPCCRTTRRAYGDPRRSPPTSETSSCTPCIGSSPDGPTPASSTNSGPASTQPLPGPQPSCHQHKQASFPALRSRPDLATH